MTSSNNEDFYSYKALKEAFVSNLKGTKRLENLLLVFYFSNFFISLALWFFPKKEFVLCV